MSGLVELHLLPPVAAALEAWGYSAADAAVRELAPAAARGQNVVLAWPPSARYAVPALAGLVSALATGHRPAVLLAPDFALDEWADAALPLARAAAIGTLVARSPGRAARRLRDAPLDLLITSPDIALALLERSALKADGLGHVVLAWPELFEHPDALAALMQDLPADAQRILHLVAPAAGHPLVERYARRALVAGPLSGEAPPPPGPAVRTVTAPWGGRAAALAAILEQDDPASLSLWCADRASAALAGAGLPAGDATVTVATGDAPAAARIVAWDLPTPARLTQLAAAGDLVLLVPPHAHGYVARVTARQTPLRIADSAESARQAAARGRGTIAGALERGGLDGELLALAPLFERHDPARVAAALYRLWQAKGEPASAAPAGPAATAPVAVPAGLVATARIWVGLGKKDGTTPADIVAALTKDLRIEAARIGRIELRETYSLVEVPADDAETIARRLNGKLIRRRTVVAKVDLGSGGRRGPAASAGSRGPSGSSPRGRPGRPRP